MPQRAELKPEVQPEVKGLPEEVKRPPEERIETTEEFKEFGEQRIGDFSTRAEKVITDGNSQLERLVKSTREGQEDDAAREEAIAKEVAAGKGAVAETRRGIKTLSASIRDKIDQSMSQLLEAETEKEKREKLAEKCQRVVEKIIEWAEQYGIDISHMKKLGGGFVNLVLLIETPEGKGYVAKAFMEKEEAIVTREAQKKLGQISKEDEPFIPKAIAWIDETTLISEKAEGKPIRKILEEARDDPEKISEAYTAFYDLGGTLASIHERTEEPLKEAGKESIEDVRVDRKKVIQHLKMHVESGLLDLSDEAAENLVLKITSISEGGYISLIHGDAHLDQFFKAPDKSTLSIVDYDSLNEGDPMADVARTLSSIRDWSRKLDVPNELLRDVERQFIKGYRNTRIEQGKTPESEFDQKKVLVYELRLSLIQLKRFNKLREKLRSALAEDQTEADFYKAYEKGEIKDMRAYGFSEQEASDVAELIAIRKNAKEIIQYLQSIEE